MQAQFVFLCKNGNGFFAHFVRGTHNADCDFTAIGDQDFFEISHDPSQDWSLFFVKIGRAN
jgi:hypothetical protein